MDNSGAVTARAVEVAISTIRQEHRRVDAVMTALQHWLARVAAGHAAPDFEFFSAVLYYIVDFTEQQHHPKEDDYLLYARIINSLPSKLRPMFQHPARADASGTRRRRKNCSTSRLSQATLAPAP